MCEYDSRLNLDAIILTILTQGIKHNREIKSVSVSLFFSWLLESLRHCSIYLHFANVMLKRMVCVCWCSQKGRLVTGQGKGRYEIPICYTLIINTYSPQLPSLQNPILCCWLKLDSCCCTIALIHRVQLLHNRTHSCSLVIDGFRIRRSNFIEENRKQ